MGGKGAVFCVVSCIARFRWEKVRQIGCLPVRGAMMTSLKGRNVRPNRIRVIYLPFEVHQVRRSIRAAIVTRRSVLYRYGLNGGNAAEQSRLDVSLIALK